VNTLGRLLLSPWTVLASILAGAVAGLWSPAVGAALAPYGDIYLALLKMCVLPIMMAALVSSLGRLLASGQAPLYVRRLALVFGLGLLAAALFGALLATAVGPGRQVDETTRVVLAQEVLRVEQATPDHVTGPAERTGFVGFLRSIVPANVFAAASSGSVLPLVFFFVLAGVALGSLRNDRAAVALRVADAAYEAMLRVIGWLMYGLPFGLACLVADQVSRTGLRVLGAMLALLGTVYLGALVLLAVYVLVIWRRVGGTLGGTLAAIREPVLVALGTSSSAASIPATLRCAHQGLRREREAGDLVVPLGVTLNPQGSAFHFAVAVVFVAQLYDQALDPLQLALVVTASVLAAVAASGAPGIAAVGMLALVLEPLELPAAVGVILLSAIDPVVDPLITAANVTATCAAVSVVADREAGDEGGDPVFPTPADPAVARDAGHG
jgi:Na+/H+-dicarboxylate symporter